MRIGVPTGVINGFDFVAMDIHKSLVCEKKRERTGGGSRGKKREGEHTKESEIDNTCLFRASLDPRTVVVSKDVKHEKKANAR